MKLFAPTLAVLVMLTGCAAMSNQRQDRLDELFRQVESGQLTAAEASHESTQPSLPGPVGDILYVVLAALTAGVGGAYPVARTIAGRMRKQVHEERDNRRRENKEPVSKELA